MVVYLNNLGDDRIVGTSTEYDQVDYEGAVNDYIMVRNGDGTVTVYHPEDGVDTLVEINGFWFFGERRWYSIDEALGLSLIHI